MDTYRNILKFLHFNPSKSRNEIMIGIDFTGSDASMKRQLALAVHNGDIQVTGAGKSVRYSLTPKAFILMPISLDTYFAQDIDERQVQTGFNYSLINNQLSELSLFTDDELKLLSDLQTEFQSHIADMTNNEYNREMERLGIDLSWKSSQIEGNTYSLLETERLLRESKTADGKTKEEAIMLLNHKDALRFVIKNPDYLHKLTISHIEDIHTLLTKELSIDKGLRHRRVGITGTQYHPLDNEFQIREAMRDMCTIINNRENVFEKALLALVLISYIQPFTDGNKRTARIVSNALLIAHSYCPLSFRTVDSIDYKKAMLLFYEQNNLHAFKQIFINQYEFAVQEYF